MCPRVDVALLTMRTERPSFSFSTDHLSEQCACPKPIPSAGTGPLPCTMSNLLRLLAAAAEEHLVQACSAHTLQVKGTLLGFLSCLSGPLASLF